MNLDELKRLPDIRGRNPKAKYALVWYNHDDPKVLYRVLRTNLGIPSDNMDPGLFKSWCDLFSVEPNQAVAKLLVAADEHFKIDDYSAWTDAPYSLPELTVRWFEIMDDEHWYVVQLA